MAFLSTLSLRRATCGCFVRCRFWAYFYPRSPCGERLMDFAPGEVFASISIHALLAESDVRCIVECLLIEIFLSTLSLRRATFRQNYECFKWIISIHALLAESDWARGSRVTYVEFLSTLSLRRATTSNKRPNKDKKFLSTLSLRRATKRVLAKVLH